MSRGRKVIRVSINSAALRKELKSRDLMLTKVSVRLGYAPQYLSKALWDGFMPEHIVQSLQELYNINPVSYVIRDASEKLETSVVEVVPAGLTDADFEKLYKIIYSAVYKATKQAFTDV